MYFVLLMYCETACPPEKLHNSEMTAAARRLN